MSLIYLSKNNSEVKLFLIIDTDTQYIFNETSNLNSPNFHLVLYQRIVKSNAFTASGFFREISETILVIIL